MKVASLLSQIPPVDAVAVEARAADLQKRSLKAETKLAAIRLAISCVDLTTLVGSDTPARVSRLCHKALRPDPNDPTVPAVAAVCVYPALVAPARAIVGNRLHVASVATGFPTGQTSLKVRLAETRQAVADGADEIDMVISRNAFLAGNYQTVFDQIVAVKHAAHPAHLKVILEVVELGDYDHLRLASTLALFAGADFIKTSTGMVMPFVPSTPTHALVMLEAIRDYFDLTGQQIGFKPAGGIKTTKQALSYLVLINETLGSDWLTPDRFRLGASTLLNDLLMQLAKQDSGSYSSTDYFGVA